MLQANAGLCVAVLEHQFRWKLPTCWKALSDSQSLAGLPQTHSQNSRMHTIIYLTAQTLHILRTIVDVGSVMTNCSGFAAKIYVRHVRASRALVHPQCCSGLSHDVARASIVQECRVSSVFILCSTITSLSASCEGFQKHQSCTYITRHPISTDRAELAVKRCTSLHTWFAALIRWGCCASCQGWAIARIEAFKSLWRLLGSVQAAQHGAEAVQSQQVINNGMAILRGLFTYPCAEQPVFVRPEPLSGIVCRSASRQSSLKVPQFKPSGQPPDLPAGVAKHMPVKGGRRLHPSQSVRMSDLPRQATDSCCVPMSLCKQVSASAIVQNGCFCHESIGTCSTHYKS